MFETEREQLVKDLKRSGRIKHKEIEKAFLRIPREVFVPETQKRYAYVDTPLEIGHGQTISAPHMVAIMCEAIDIDLGHTVLEIGTGSGYHAAIVSQLVGEEGHVYTLERFPQLAEKAKTNLELVNITNVTVQTSDGSLGLPVHAPYDRIYVTCAAPKIPHPLLEQLRDPGKLLIPVGRFLCRLELLEKNGNQITSVDLGGCAFVPLVGKYGY